MTNWINFKAQKWQDKCRNDFDNFDKYDLNSRNLFFVNLLAQIESIEMNEGRVFLQVGRNFRNCN
jgi:uncharacterized membrane protein YjdF